MAALQATNAITLQPLYSQLKNNIRLPRAQAQNILSSDALSKCFAEHRFMQNSKWAGDYTSAASMPAELSLMRLSGAFHHSPCRRRLQ